jgi:hypothetical protein
VIGYPPEAVYSFVSRAPQGALFLPTTLLVWIVINRLSHDFSAINSRINLDHKRRVTAFYRPLIEATEANWSRRNYFRKAMFNSEEVQITRPYRSLTSKNQCITISALMDTFGG